MIRIAGFDEEKMNRIEDSLLNAYMAQKENDDLDLFFQQNAPQEYLDYSKAYHAERARLKREGKMA